MKSLIRISFASILLLSTLTTFGQVTGLKYMMKYNTVDTTFDCYIVINGGSATTMLERTQFNAQYSIVVPTKTRISIKKSFAPSYNGILPTDWSIVTGVKAPSSQPDYDFITIAPGLIPASQYKILSSGDTIKLFSFQVDTLAGCLGDIRILDNVQDKDAGLPILADLMNGFTIGSISQLYQGNISVTHHSFLGADTITCSGSTITLTKPANITGTWRLASTIGIQGVSLVTLPNGDASISFASTINNKSFTVMYQNNTKFDYKCIRVENVKSPLSVSLACVGQTILLPLSQHGTWIVNNSAVASVTAGGLLTCVSSGLTTLTYNPTVSGQCPYFESNALRIFEKPIATITGDSTFCEGGFTTLTANEGISYIWSGGNNTTKTVAVASPGVIWVTVTDSNGCSNSASKIIDYISSPVVGFSNGTSTCVGLTKQLFPSSGGTWVSNSPAIATVNSMTGVITPISQGQANFTFTSTSNGCSRTTSQFIINPPPTIHIAKDTICVGNTTTLSPSSGGTWVSMSSAIATLSAGTTVTGITPGLARFRFTETVTGCQAFDTVIVQAKPVITNGAPQICVGGITQLSPVSGGTWSSSNGAQATISNSGLVTGISVSTSVNFTFTTSAGCVSLPSSDVQVLSTPDISNNAPKNLCVGASTQLMANMDGVWSSSDTTIATVSQNELVEALKPGKVRITLKSYTNECSDFVDIEVYPSNYIINTGLSTICISGTTVLTAPCLQGGGSWNALDPLVATITNTGVVSGVIIGTARFTLTASDGSVSNIVSVNVLDKIPTSVTGPLEICVGGTTQLSPATGGSWISTNTSVATVRTDGLITGVSPGVSEFIFISATGCPSDPITIISVNPNPTVSTGPGRVCVGSTIQLLPSTGGTWVSNHPAIATIHPNTGVVTGISAGTVSFTFTTGSGCPSNPTSPVIVNSKPVTNLSLPSICVGNTTTITPLAGGTWAKIPSASIVANITNAGIITSGSPGTIQFAFTQTSTGCASEPSSILTVTAGVSVNVPDANLCIGENVTLTTTPSASGTWSSSNTAVAAINTTTGVVTAISQGQTTFAFVDAGGCSSVPSTPIIVNNIPSVDIVGHNAVCVGQSTQLTPSSGGTWTSNNPGAASVSNTGLVTGISEGSATFIFTSTAGCVSISTIPIIVGFKLVYDRHVFISNGEDLNISIKDANKFKPITLQITPIPNANITGQTSYLSNDSITITDVLTKNITGPAIAKYLVSATSIALELCSKEDTLYVHIDEHNFDRTLRYCVFADVNKNDVYDPQSDQLLSNVHINIPAIHRFKLTNTQGETFFKLDTSTYIIKLEVPYGEWEQRVMYDTVRLDQVQEQKIMKAFVPIVRPPNGSVYLNTGNLRCNSPVHIFASASNLGSLPLSGKLVLKHNKRVTLGASDKPYIRTADNEIYWDIKNLYLSQNFRPNVVAYIPSAMGNNDSLVFMAYLISDIGDTLSTYSYADVIGCSYDPNDKRSWPDRVGDLNYTLREEKLIYQIRFQNTGNDTAYVVRIADVLDSHLDMRTLQILNSSHPVETELNGDTLNFIFDNIYLVDSLTNPLLSQGFVSFTIDEFMDIPDMTAIHNRVAIYFDKNEPVITNRTTNTIVNELPCPINALWITNDTLRVNTSLNVYHWYDCQADTIIATTDVPWFKPSHNGTYYATIEGEFCAVRTKCIAYVISSSQDVNVPQVTIYPNPASEMVQIISDREIISYQITDVFGNMIVSKNVGNETQVFVPLQDCISGTYLVNIITVKGQAFKKMVVR